MTLTVASVLWALVFGRIIYDYVGSGKLKTTSAVADWPFETVVGLFLGFTLLLIAVFVGWAVPLGQAWSKARFNRPVNHQPQGPTRQIDAIGIHIKFSILFSETLISSVAAICFAGLIVLLAYFTLYAGYITFDTIGKVAMPHLWLATGLFIVLLALLFRDAIADP